MTSLSNIFRSSRTISEEGNIKEITIRNLHMPTVDGKEEVISKESLYLERDRMLNDARRQIELEKADAEHMRQMAQEDIAAMQAAWEQEKTALQQQAYEEGFQVGYEEGRSKSISDMSESLKVANEVTLHSKENALKYLEEQERIILEIAMRTAERILGKKLEEDEEVFLSIVKRGLKEAREMKEIKLYVSVFQFELVSSNRAELASIFPPDVPFLIFANDDFDTNDCIIETNQGRIVVSVDEQLNELKEKLVELLESGD
ncbi:flagellar assembly protein FliH [Sporosarcina luteola]|uniref:flagellar assembly protein FliH n=1 Tax=Bacillales TaxID=1385 RepID=UPI00203D1434|nr:MULTISPECIES: flagellar assembly protein FliH [Bacillales]MCM3637878.1 flagellar assembly protein FliH [Sporosarcina luteola]